MLSVNEAKKIFDEPIDEELEKELDEELKKIEHIAKCVSTYIICSTVYCEHCDCRVKDYIRHTKTKKHIKNTTQ